MGAPIPRFTQRVHPFWTALLTFTALMTMAACGPEIDEEFPPGDPTLGGDGPPLEIVEVDDTNYVLWGLLAVGFIAAGLLLVSVERWERRRAEVSDNEADS